jgi:NitT/TauT family transport system substrate-binding protein
VTTIRVAFIPIEPAAEGYYAREMGFFTKAGLDVDLQPMLNSNAIAAALVAGAIDIGYSTPMSLALAHAKGIGIIAIAPAAEYVAAAPVSALLVAASSPIRSAKDLNGKIVAANGLGTITEYGPRAWIDRNGGDAASVKFVELAFSAMPAALDAGRVDAAEIAEPALSVAKRTARVLTTPYDALGKDFLLSLWVATPQWAKDHPDLVTRFATAMHATAAWADVKQNQPRSAEILAKFTKVDPAVLATSTRARYGERLDAAAMQTSIDVAAKYGKFTTFPAQEIIFSAAR